MNSIGKIKKHTNYMDSSDNIDKIGYLELVIGPMFSGKTSKLLELYKQFNYCNIPVLVINHEDDKRYHETNLSTHDKQMIPCISTKILKDLFTTDTLEKYNVILINEGQFFSDIKETVVELVDTHKKQVYICGLDGDFKRKKFGNLIDLIPYCNKVTKLTSLCALCKNGTLGVFTHRLTNHTEQIIIGSDSYIPVCRGCYLEKCQN